MKHRSVSGFGKRLAQIRKSHGLTQTELAKKVGTSQRVIAYYELESDQPPGAILIDLAKALKVSSDELLGLKPIRENVDPKTARLLKKLQKIEKLPAEDRRVLLKIIDALLKSRTVVEDFKVGDLEQKVLSLKRAAASQ